MEQTSKNTLTKPNRTMERCLSMTGGITIDMDKALMVMEGMAVEVMGVMEGDMEDMVMEDRALSLYPCSLVALEDVDLAEVLEDQATRRQ